MNSLKKEKKEQRMLVTGATGFVGANLTRRLVKDGYDVHILTRQTSKKWRLEDILPEIKEHCMDLLEADKLTELVKKIKPDFIFHLATAGIYGGKHLPERELIEANFIGTFNLINACEDTDYKCFVNTGSSSEYGPKDTKMKESDICEPINMYGVTKLTSTLYSRLKAKLKDRPIITLRLFSPYGPYDDSSRLMTYAIINAIKNKELNLANPQTVRDYIYVDDVTDMYMKCMDKADKYKGEIFNVGSGSETKISEVIDKIIRFIGSKSAVKWNSVAPRPFDAVRWEADIAKSCKSFDWKPKYSVDEGLKKSISWFKENLFLYN